MVKSTLGPVEPRTDLLYLWVTGWRLLSAPFLAASKGLAVGSRVDSGIWQWQQGGESMYQAVVVHNE